MKKILAALALALLPALGLAQSQCGPLYPVNQVTSMSSIYAVNLECAPNVCPPGEFAGGIDQKGNAIDCATPGGGGIIALPTTFQSSVTFNGSPLDAVFNYETDFQGVNEFGGTATFFNTVTLDYGNTLFATINSTGTFYGPVVFQGPVTLSGAVVQPGGNVEVMVSSVDFVSASTVTFSNLASSVTYRIVGVVQMGGTSGTLAMIFNGLQSNYRFASGGTYEAATGIHSSAFCGAFVSPDNGGGNEMQANSGLEFSQDLLTTNQGTALIAWTFNGAGAVGTATGTPDNWSGFATVPSGTGLNSFSIIARSSNCQTAAYTSLTFSGHLELWQGASHR